MEVKSEIINNTIVVQIEGRIDSVNSPELEVKLDEVLKNDINNIIVDCEKLTYISSSGLRSFLVLQKKITAKSGSLTIQNMHPDIYKIFEITGFSRLMNIITSNK